jgi:PAS domain S-box-containing protein
MASTVHLTDLDPRVSIFADREGVIRAWGSAWVEAFGYSEKEALGHSLDLIVPEALQPLHWRGFRRAMRTGRLKRPGAILKVPGVHKNGSLIPVRFVDGTVVRGEGGNAAGIRLSFMRRDPAWMGLVYRVVVGLLAPAQSVLRAVTPSKRTQG